MTPVYAENALLQFFKDGDYTDFACITDFSITTTTETKDVRTLGDGFWAKKRGQRMAYTLNCSGLVFLEEVQPSTFWLLKDYQHQMLHVGWRAIFDDPSSGLIKVLTGTVIISQSVIAAASTGFATGDFTLEGHGSYSVEDSASVCEATIESITPVILDGFVGIDYDNVTAYVERLDYTINGGGRETIYLTGTSGQIPLGDLPAGTYTIVVYPICPDNGIDGESQSVTFEVTEEGEIAECDAPVAMYTVVLEPTYAQIQWDYFGDWPAGGFLWQLIDLTIGSEVQSGIAMTNGIDALGLVPGHNYQFRVKTLCESGVSESGFFADTFTTPADDSCNAPGTPSFSNITGTSFDASWAAASPTPADGYQWYVYSGVTPIDSGTTSGTTASVSGLTEGATYEFRVQSVCGGGATSAFATAEVATSTPCNVPGTPSMSSITSSTATATWTAASPAPGSGYEWQLLEGVTVVQSGSTGSLSVNLTGLDADTTYSFRVRSSCGGGSFSSYASASFDTELADNIDWSFAPGPFVGSLEIKRNAAVIVSVTSADSGTFVAAGGDSIEMTIDANSETGQIEAYNTTTSTNELSITGTGVQSGSFAVADGNNYSLTGTISS